MNKLTFIEWGELLVPTHSVAEMVLRGSAMYLALFLIMRFVMVRQSSTIGIADILVIVIIADAAQNAFAKEYQSLTEGIALVLTIVSWDIFELVELSLQNFREAFNACTAAFGQGRKNASQNMRRELITEEELRGQFRLQGILHMDEVKSAFLEANGDISAIKYDKDEQPQKRETKVF